MSLFETHTSLLVVFFIYGLAFFSMGIALTLEAFRSSLQSERRLLIPLALFGLLHGMHEWAEIYIMQRVWLGQPFPVYVTWLRLGWLTLSFVPLIIYGVSGFTLLPQIKAWQTGLRLVLGVVFIGLVISTLHINHIDRLQHVDALVRYFLAVPGAVLAAVRLNSQARQLKIQHNAELSTNLTWMAVGFGLYGLTQVFVPPSDMIPAIWINTATFQAVTRLPVQFFRAGFAVIITIFQLRGVQCIERNRQEQLSTAQQARLEALEQVQQELMKREALRRDLLRHTVRTQEEERTRIARELHDETAQLLTAVSLNLATLKQTSKKSPQTSELVDRLQELVRQMSQGIYRLVHDLRPAQLDDLGLLSALQYLADQVKTQSGLTVELIISGERRRIDPLLETVIFRVAQEALNNVSRHARVQQTTLRLSLQPNQVLFQVQDAGIGFQVQSNYTSNQNWGILGMRERVESVGGKFVIESTPGKGTLVEATFPIEAVSIDQKLDTKAKSDV